MADPVITQVANRLDIPKSEARLVLNALSKLIHQQAQREGKVRVPGIGIFEDDEGTLKFHPDDSLERLANHRYESMTPLAPVELPDEIYAAAAPPEDTAEDRAEARDQKSDETAVPPLADAEDGYAEPDDKEAASTEIVPEDAGAEEKVETEESVPVDASDEGVSAAAEDRPAEDRPVEPSERDEKRSRAPFVVAIAVLLLLAGGAGAWWFISTDREVPPADEEMAIVEPETEEEPLAEEPEEDPSGVPDDDAAVPTDDPADEAAPAEEEAAQPEAIVPGEGGYSLVVGSTTDGSDAESIFNTYQSDVEAQDLPIAIVSTSENGATRYRVVVGQFTSQADADSALEAHADILPGDAWVLALSTDMSVN